MVRNFSNFIDVLRYRACEQSDQIAFTWLQDGETELGHWTYQALDREARSIAAKLQALSAPGERALLLYPPGLEFISAFFGCLYAGVIAVPAYPPRANRSFERLRAIIDDADAAFALTTQAFLKTFEKRLVNSEAQANFRCLATDTMGLHLADEWRNPQLTTETLAFLQYTSGSTGTPKGVMVSHGNLLNNAMLINRCFQDSDRSRGVSWLPPYHDMGLIGGILQPVYVNAPTVLMSPVTFLQRPLRWLQAIANYRGTTSGGPNFAYELCLSQITPEQKATLDLSRWTLAFTGAEPIRAETLARFADAFQDCGFRREAFFPCYGMAETTLIVSGAQKALPPVLETVSNEALKRNLVESISPPDSQSTFPLDEERGTAITLVGCGTLASEQQIAIVNPETLTACPANGIGEIWVAGENVAQGYWQRPEQSQQIFQAYIAHGEIPNGKVGSAQAEYHHNGKGGNGKIEAPPYIGPYLRTGDLGFLKDGELFITGRLKDLIIIRGRNHYPQDIEHTLETSHPALRTSCSAAFSVEVDLEERLVVVCEIQRSHLRRLKATEVCQAIRQAILGRHELQPYAVLLLKTGSIPKTSSGKITRYACKANFLDDSLITVGEWRQRAVLSIESPAPAQKAAIALDHPVAHQEQQSLQYWLIQQIAQKTGLSPSEIDVWEPFASYGLDSVQAVRLSAQLEDWLGRKFPPTLAYDYPTIASLTQYLAKRSPRSLGSAATAKTPQSKVVAHGAIAIIGIGCCFPEAENPDAFWELLCQGKNGIRSASHRWQEHPELAEGFGGFLTQIDHFDASFFGISPREAIRMDPQQRLLLEVSWEALERAGIVPQRLAGSDTGVFIGLSSGDYSQLQVRSHLPVNAYSGTGNAHSIAANRLSYWLDLRGPSLTVDTACSSSLVAVHLACQSLQSGECAQAVVGGVNLILAPELTQSFTAAGMMAADGRCKTFDANADGYVRGEGCGVVILKRLDDAVRDGDSILATIEGSAINQDGRSNGLTAPNGPAQRAVIQQALNNAGVEAAQISYVETHGTGTSLGDPIEVNALTSVLANGRSGDRPCWLGSVKTNIGHLEAAAGIAGLIKLVLCLEHRQIPPHLNLQTLNPHIDFGPAPIQIPTQLQPWYAGNEPRFGGVSSFGFGGTNAHVILKESPPASRDVSHLEKTKPALTERSSQLLTLSAKTLPALQAMGQSYCQFLQDRPQIALADFCWSANTRRSHFSHRKAVWASSVEELQTQLVTMEVDLEQRTDAVSGHLLGRPKLTFLFTGQGAQYTDMGRELYHTQPHFRATIDQCAELLRPYLEHSLIEVLYPGWESEQSGNVAGNQTALIDETRYTQPALFALEYALAQLWRSWGIVPDAVMGHSVGEYVAACLAGVFSLEDGLKLIAERSRLMQEMTAEGAMAAVFADIKIVTHLVESLKTDCAIAAVNGPRNTVISGTHAGIEQAIMGFKAQGIKTKSLQVSRAFHSPLMEPILEKFNHVAQQIDFAKPKIAILSNLTGRFADDSIATADYWVQHIRAPVQFFRSFQTLQQQEYQIFVEAGPKPTLLGMGRYCLPETDGVWLPSLRPGQSDWSQLNQSLAQLYEQGLTIDWDAYAGTAYQERSSKHRVILPTYPFQRQRYWFEAAIETKSNPPQQSPITAQEPTLDSYHVQWQSIEIDTTAAVEAFNQTLSQAWLIFADTRGLGEAIAQQLEQQGQQAYLIHAALSEQLSETGLKRLENGRRYWQIDPLSHRALERLFEDIRALTPQIGGIIHLWGLDAPSWDKMTTTALEQSQRMGCGSVLHVIQILGKQRLNPCLWLATRGTQPIGKQTQTQVLNPTQSPLWGLGKVIALEHPDCWGGMIDFPGVTEGSTANIQNENRQMAAQCLAVIANRSRDNNDQFAWRDGQCYGAQLTSAVDVAIGDETAEVTRRAIQEEGTYLITGGLGALGIAIAQWLVEQGARHLVLLSRRPPSDTVQTQITAWEQARVTVQVAKVDVANRGDVVQLFATIAETLPPLRGVIHAAGMIDDGVLQGLSWERFAKVLAPKVQGAWHLHQCTQTLTLDFFVLFSSVASMMGSPGQGNYAAANAYLDAIAAYRRTQGLPALSINWGPWTGVGMAATTRLMAKGMQPLSVNQGLRALGQLLTQNLTQVGVMRADWGSISQQFPDLVRSAYFQAVIPELGIPTREGEPQRRVIYDQVLAMAPTERENFLVGYLQATLAQILQLSDEPLAPTANLLDHGLDSLMTMEAINQLKGDLQLMLYPREFYERPRILALAKYLAQEFSRAHDKEVVTAQELLVNNAVATSVEITAVAQQTATPKEIVAPAQRLPSVVFLLSGPRCGSTLLRVMLAGHPALSVPPELHLLPFQTMGQRDRQVSAGHLGEGLARTLMELQGVDAQRAQQTVTDWVQQDTPIDVVYRQLQELVGERLLIDKSPSYAFEPGTLARGESLFIGAKYIHLTRHPYAAIESFCRLRMDKMLGAGAADPHQLAESIWTRSNQNILNLAQGIAPERYYHLRYEDLVRSPASVMPALCQFLGIGFDPAVLAPYQGDRLTDGLHEGSLSLGDPNFLNHQQIEPQLGEAWRKIRLPGPLSDLTQQVAHQFHYELPIEQAFESAFEPENLCDLNASDSVDLPQMTELYVNIRGMKICLCTWGPEAGPLVLCLHGILEQGAAWLEVAASLAQKGYRVVAPDLRGHGRSEHVSKGDSYNIVDFLGDIDAIVEQLSDRAITLVGHSLGSVIAAIFTSIRPQRVKNLVLVETVLPSEANDDEAVEQLTTHLDYLASPPDHPIFPDVASAAERLRLATPALSPALAFQLAQRITEPCSGGVRWRWSSLLRTRAGLLFNGIGKAKYLNLLKRIQVPIALVYGDRSNFNRDEDLSEQQAAMPEAVRIVLPGGHNLHLEAPLDLAKIIRNFAI